MTISAGPLPEESLLQGGKYRIISVLGQGGFGITYLARHQELEMDVAIKELFLNAQGTFCTRNASDHTVHPHFSPEKFAEFRDRFLQEARTLARFRNVPGVVRVMDTFSEHGTAYFVMELVQGPSLRKYVEENGPFSIEAATDFAKKLLEALQQVHEGGVLHRDINPNNILVTSGLRPVLIDFGISREYQEDAALTQTTFRTVGYSAPEQAVLKAKRGAYTDIYGVGATLYFMLSGQRPQTAEEVELDGLITLQTLNEAVPDELAAVVHKAMSKKPAERYQSAREMLEALDRLAPIKIRSHVQTRKTGPNASRPTPAEDLVTRLDVENSDGPATTGPTGRASAQGTAPAAATPLPSEDKTRHKNRTRAVIAGLVTLLIISMLAILLVLWLIPDDNYEAKLKAELLAKAHTFELEGNRDSALHFAQLAFERFPDDTALGRYVNYLENSLLLLSPDKLKADLLIDAADDLFQKQQYAEAKNRYQEIVNTYPHVLNASVEARIKSQVARCDSILDKDMPFLAVINKESDAASELRRKLIGTHPMTLAELAQKSPGSSGSVRFWEESGALKMEGRHYAMGNTYEIQGELKKINKNIYFEIFGSSSLKLTDHSPCNNFGTFRFQNQGSGIWRYKDNSNPCGGTFHWVDISIN